MMIEIEPMTEQQRRAAATWLTYIGWWGAFVLLLIDEIAVNADPNSRVARGMGILIVLLIGVAIAAGAARGRMRLTDTITSVFEAGLNAVEEPRRTCVMETDTKGIIQWVENADVIGWQRNALIGHDLRDLLPERMRVVHDANVMQLMNSNSGREIGPTLTLALLTQGGQEITVQKMLSRLGTAFIATVTLMPGDSTPRQTGSAEVAPLKTAASVKL